MLSLVGLASLLLPLCGCMKAFDSTGRLVSAGGVLDRWSERPDGCSRDPQDGHPAADTTSVLSLVWSDPYEETRPRRQEQTPDVPLRLDIRRTPAGFEGLLQTRKRPEPVTLDARVCSALKVEAHEEPRLLPEGRPVLSGHLTLDCTVLSSHITSTLDFRRCSY